MIDELLFKVNHVGKDGFIWWIGQVAPRDAWKDKVLTRNYLDPNKAAKNWPERCKVRIIGYHSFRKDQLKDEELPWAHIMIDPMFGSSQGGEGATSNLTGGEVCFGFFLDGDDAQQPVIVGLLHRHRAVENLPEDSEFAFQPFTGHPSNVSSTKREAPSTTKPKKAPSAVTPSTEVNNPGIGYTDGNWGYFQEPLAGFSTSSNFTELSKLNLGVGITSSFNINFPDTLWTCEENLAVKAFLKKVTFTYTPPSSCKNNLIGQITQILQDFIGFTNSIQKYANVYIDPILNKVVEIGDSIKSTARSIGGIIRLIVNSIRGGLLKCIIALFKKFIGIFVPCPQQTIISQSVKNILDKLFCIFEKLIPFIIDFIEGLLSDLVDSIFNAPICAIEQLVAAILANVMNSIEESIDLILSGINWLTGGLSNVFNVLNQASNLASQIYSFIGCDQLKCDTPSKWVSTLGPSQTSADNWNRMVGNINIFKGISDGLGSIEDAISGLSLYGGSPEYENCNRLVNNPVSQRDLPLLLPGVRLSKCVPPFISVVGDGKGAFLEPIVAPSGGIIGVNVAAAGSGFKRPPTLTVIDNSGYGSGARVKALIDDDGSIKSVVILDAGRGYCQGKVGFSTIGDGTDPPVGDVSAPSDLNDSNREDLDDGSCDPPPPQTNYPENDQDLINNPDILPLSPFVRLSVSRNRIYEGESVIFTVTSSNRALPKRVEYKITGVTQNDIRQKLNDILYLDEGKASIQIDTIQDEIINYKQLVFTLVNYNQSVSVLISDIEESIEDRVYALSSDQYVVNEGSSFTVTLKTKNVVDGANVPFTITGIDSRLIQNYNAYKQFIVNKNEASLRFETNKSIITNNQIFRLELNNKQASIGILINKITTQDEIKDPKVCIDELVVISPGLGYQVTDTATDGINTYKLIISPENGAIFGVEAIPNPNCGFDDIPEITINTNTGIGAEIAPAVTLDKNPSTTPSTGVSGIGTGFIKVIDCV